MANQWISTIPNLANCPELFRPTPCNSAKKSIVFRVELRFYDSVGFLNDLIECVGRPCAGLVDKRRGTNLQFSMRDIVSKGMQ